MESWEEPKKKSIAVSVCFLFFFFTPHPENLKKKMLVINVVNLQPDGSKCINDIFVSS